jgi:hypothetical protein
VDSRAYPRSGHHPRRLLDRQAAEESKLDDTRAAWVDAHQRCERLIERNQIRATLLEVNLRSDSVSNRLVRRSV